MPKKWNLKTMNWWPPLAGAGIRIKKIAPDNMTIDVEMKSRPWNRNYNGTHYGGSIFSMTDPFYAMILIKNLGDDYIVWDKAAEIQFLKPGKGKLSAHFNISAQRIADIKNEADTKNKSEPKFIAEVKDEQGNIIARVNKTLYVRRKDKTPPSRRPKP